MSLNNTIVEIDSSDSSMDSFMNVQVPFKRTTSSSNVTNDPKRTKTNETPILPSKAHIPSALSSNYARVNPDISHAALATTSSLTKQQRPTVTPMVKKPTQRKANMKPHALLWICSCGKGQSRTWKQKSLKVIGVYASKEDAERKKGQLMNEYDCCGHGDILVGDTWEDEIDLVVRPIEEVSL